jgi:hypothetical protein
MSALQEGTRPAHRGQFGNVILRKKKVVHHCCKTILDCSHILIQMAGLVLRFSRIQVIVLLTSLIIIFPFFHVHNSYVTILRPAFVNCVMAVKNVP